MTIISNTNSGMSVVKEKHLQTLGRMKTSVATIDTSLEVSQKARDKTIIEPSKYQRPLYITTEILADPCALLLLLQ